MIPRKPLALVLSALVLAALPAEAQRRRSSRRSRRAPTVQASRLSGTGPGPFAGVWTVQSNTEVSVTTPILRTETRQTRERIAIGPGTGADMELMVSNERGETCRLVANRRGSAITLPSDQLCYFTDAVQNITFAFTLQRGAGSLRGTRLTLDFSWTVFANVGMVINGTAVQRSEGSMGDQGPMNQPAFAPRPPSMPTW